MEKSKKFKAEKKKSKVEYEKLLREVDEEFADIRHLFTPYLKKPGDKNVKCKLLDEHRQQMAFWDTRPQIPHDKWLEGQAERDKGLEFSEDYLEFRRQRKAKRDEAKATRRGMEEPESPFRDEGEEAD
mmetsp:Transcript_41581/g.64905  ORF Transcript_41581/g.64905 Transcript_41581/m.64905 type:complete len:128 (+) Transcript_41581:546-929(+)